MAQQILTIPEERIENLYENVTTGPFANNAEKIIRFTEGDADTPSYPTRISNLQNEINTLKTDNDYNSLKQEINNYTSEIGNLPTIAHEELMAYQQIWENKRAIVTTMTNGQPDFIGIYEDLTNADFATGSICFCLTN